MKISETELYDLLVKVYEGMGLAYGQYQDCARALTWLAMHGVLTPAQLGRRIPGWILPPAQAATIEQEDEETVVLQTRMNPSLLTSGLALELAAYKALQSGAVTVLLREVEFPFLILPSLPLVAAKGFDCDVTWREQDGTGTAVAISAHDELPRPIQSPGTVPGPPGSLTITCRQQTALPPARTGQKTTSIWGDSYNRHSQDGLDIDVAQWEELQALARAVLVPSSDRSRQGAGEVGNQGWAANEASE